ncbi:MAG: flagellar biosynthetic protein FliO [Maioricimonas sp. JB045]
MDEDLALLICPTAAHRYRFSPVFLAAGTLLLCGFGSESATAQSEMSGGTARVLVNSGDRPVEVPAPIQAPPRIAAPSSLPFDRRATDRTSSDADEAAMDIIELDGPAEPIERTPIRRDEDAEGSTAGRNATPMWLGVLIIAGTLAGVLLLVRFGRQLQPGPPELPLEALQSLGQQRLTPQLTLHLLQMGDRLLLVGVGTDGARTLTEIDDPAEVQQMIGFCRSGQSTGTNAGRKPFLAWPSKDRPARQNTVTSGGAVDRIDWRERAGMVTSERAASGRGPSDG